MAGKAYGDSLFFFSIDECYSDVEISNAQDARDSGSVADSKIDT